MLRKSRRLKSILLALVILAPVLSCAACWWIVFGANSAFRENLPQYPYAQEIAYADGYWGAGTAVKTLYFWTPDTLEQVQNYYEMFTLPFINTHYVFAYEKSDYVRTVFNPSSNILPIITDEWTSETVDPLQNRVCHRRLPLQCVQVELIHFDENEPIALRPYPGPMRMYATPVSPSPELKGGTLIVYIYYEDDFS